MRTHAKLALLIGLAGLGSGCMSDAYRRADGLTDGAGDKLAGNTVMQMVDPWQYGVQDTKLMVPAARATAPADAVGASNAGQSQTMSGSSS
ncbi:hypothetical protein [Mesorhizobium sp. YM1C-6-2]|uniref:hypothetical protein n=1 Tax=Mesorhizobium sp. YM1C-6-2 TaxID=1827501 RepID=UPI000EF23CC6|nr:hypothetical protein [Mesorhizobium sp. YM1C-6-2]RLP24411.1 hypothetical protein D8676_17195 [Mesorhizobium sp. YM1C-6-2]